MSLALEFRSRIDDCSYQVAAENDSRFWFRLKREANRDIITDFFIGRLATAQAAKALIACYQYLRLEPQRVLVFRDIVPSDKYAAGSSQFARALLEARCLYLTCGRALLRRSGIDDIEDQLEENDGRYGLIVRPRRTHRRLS